MRRLMWITIVLMALTLSIGLFAGVSSARNGADAHPPLSAPGTYYKTFTGLDFHTPDSDDVHHPGRSAIILSTGTIK